jgi:hypothetical protein
MDHYHFEATARITMTRALSLHRHKFFHLFGKGFQLVKRPKVLLLTLVVLVVLSGLFWFMNTYIRQFLASQYSAQITFTPSKEEVAVGEEFTIYVQMSGEVVSAADWQIEFTDGIVKHAKEITPSGTGFTQLADEPYFSPPLVERVASGGNDTRLLNLVLVSRKANKDTVEFGLTFRGEQEGIAHFVLLTQDSKLSGTVEQGIASYIDLPASVQTQVRVIGSGGSITPSPTSLTPSPPETITPPSSEGTSTPTPTPTSSPTPTVGPTIDPSETITPPPSEGTSTPTPMPTVGSNTTITPIASPSNSPNPTQAQESTNHNVTLDMKVRLQGVVVQPREAYREQSMKVLVLSTDKAYRKEQTIPFTAGNDAVWSGTIDLSNVPIEKTFQIFVKGNKHLQRKVCALIPNETVSGQYDCNNGQIQFVEGINLVNMSSIYVLAGDIPIQNGIIDSMDIIFVRKNLGITSPAVLSRADFNLDGIVDTQDYTLAITALGFKYDEK